MYLTPVYHRTVYGGLYHLLFTTGRSQAVCIWTHPMGKANVFLFHILNLLFRLSPFRFPLLLFLVAFHLFFLLSPPLSFTSYTFFFTFLPFSFPLHLFVLSSHLSLFYLTPSFYPSLSPSQPFPFLSYPFFLPSYLSIFHLNLPLHPPTLHLP